MKYIFRLIGKLLLGIWDFFFLFVGAPYEEQAKRLDLDSIEPVMSGPENEKTTHQFYRANKVSN